MTKNKFYWKINEWNEKYFIAIYARNYDVYYSKIAYSRNTTLHYVINGYHVQASVFFKYNLLVYNAFILKIKRKFKNSNTDNIT